MFLDNPADESENDEDEDGPEPGKRADPDLEHLYADQVGHDQ
ncbi:hypothetical protein ACYJ1Y_04375 [Natrialbaceae archaeon A-gly3]